MDLQKLKTGFAKIHGEDFEYYVQSYSIVLGRNSKKATVDLDLASMGTGEGDTGGAAMNISRSHARIFYDFQAKDFMLEVLGKNGVMINGVMRPASSPPLPLKSQDLLQIGTKKFYFLLPAPLKLSPAEMMAQMVGGGNGVSKRKKNKAPGDSPAVGPPAKQRVLSPEASEKAGQVDLRVKVETSEVVAMRGGVEGFKGVEQDRWVEEPANAGSYVVGRIQVKQEQFEKPLEGMKLVKDEIVQ